MDKPKETHSTHSNNNSQFSLASQQPQEGQRRHLVHYQPSRIIFHPQVRSSFALRKTNTCWGSLSKTYSENAVQGFATFELFIQTIFWSLDMAHGYLSNIVLVCHFVQLCPSHIFWAWRFSLFLKMIWIEWHNIKTIIEMWTKTIVT